MTPRQSEAKVGGTSRGVETPAAGKLMVDNSHANAANTALGVSVGALVGSLIGLSILPGIGIAIAPVSVALIGGVVGNYAKRIAAKLHSAE